MSIRSTVRDRVTHSTPEAAALGAFGVITALQEIHPANQVLSLAAAFKVTADVLRFDTAELMQIVGRMQADCTFRNEDTFSAISAYVDGEITKRFT